MKRPTRPVCALRLSLLALSVVAIAGCAAREATEEAKNDALSRYVACLNRAAPTYDDGRSDASTIGVVINNACRQDFQRWLDVSAQGQNAEVRQIFFARMEKRGVELATQVVLKRRAALR